MGNERGDRDHEASFFTRNRDDRFNRLFTDQRQLDKETLDVLSGRRIKERRQSAVRIEDLTGILQLPPKPQVKTLSSAPTAADYNLLKRDVEKLYEQLAMVAGVLKDKLNPPLPKTKITTTPP